MTDTMNESTDKAPSRIGKLLILAMVAAGLLLAGYSWWFRYRATHQAAKFWGPAAAALIRDAQTVVAWRSPAPRQNGAISGVNAPNEVNLARAPGITHLRTALLEDRSYDWVRPVPTDPIAWQYGLRFVGEHGLTLRLSSDCHWLLAEHDAEEPISTPIGPICCEPIADGLQLVLEENLARTAAR